MRPLASASSLVSSAAGALASWPSSRRRPRRRSLRCASWPRCPISGPSPARSSATWAEVQVATRPGQNPHDLEIRPSQILLVKRAEILVRNGLEEDAWIDPVVESSGNPRLLRGSPSVIEAVAGPGAPQDPLRAASTARSATSIRRATRTSRSIPAPLPTVTANIVAGLGRLRPDLAERLEANRRAFLDDVAAAAPALDARCWRRTAARAVVSYHDSWPYFYRAFGLEELGVIEDRPGVPPSPQHLAALIRQMRERAGEGRARRELVSDRHRRRGGPRGRRPRAGGAAEPGRDQGHRHLHRPPGRARHHARPRPGANERTARSRSATAPPGRAARGRGPSRGPSPSKQAGPRSMAGSIVRVSWRPSLGLPSSRPRSAMTLPRSRVSPASPRPPSPPRGCSRSRGSRPSRASCGSSGR